MQTDPDDAPLLTAEWAEGADLYHGTTLIRRGRPKSDAPKQQVSIRLDADLLDRLKASGKGWQGRVNDMLRKAMA
jgi:uncharacterized protein (DUF4415 family)